MNGCNGDFGSIKMPERVTGMAVNNCLKIYLPDAFEYQLLACFHWAVSWKLNVVIKNGFSYSSKALFGGAGLLGLA